MPISKFGVRCSIFPLQHKRFRRLRKRALQLKRPQRTNPKLHHLAGRQTRHRHRGARSIGAIVPGFTIVQRVFHPIAAYPRRFRQPELQRNFPFHALAHSPQLIRRFQLVLVFTAFADHFHARIDHPNILTRKIEVEEKRNAVQGADYIVFGQFFERNRIRTTVRCLHQCLRVGLRFFGQVGDVRSKNLVFRTGSHALVHIGSKSGQFRLGEFFVRHFAYDRF